MAPSTCVVYTLWLKRTTSQNIVIGGAAGAFPPLAGWAAAHGGLGLGAVFLFLIVLLWTPPHFWALALLLAPHYAAAGVPMMPVVRGATATAQQVLIYSLALVAVTLVPGLARHLRRRLPALRRSGSGRCCARSHGGCGASASPARAGVLFHYSLLYLALLFVAVALDAVIR